MRQRPLSRRELLRSLAALGVAAPAAALAQSAAPSARAAPSQHVAAASARLALINPRLAHPVFAEPGGTIHVEVATAERLDPRGWGVQLRSDLGAAWACPVLDTQTEGIDYGRQQGYRLIVQLPSHITPELLTLEVRHTSAENRLVEERAVSVVPSLWSDCYLLQLTDEHVMYDSVKHPKCDDPRSGYRSADLVRWATPVVNLINPRLVINSGDQAHLYATSGWRYQFSSDIYRCYLDAKRNYRVPSLMTLGNHECHEHDAGQRARDWANWESLAGRRSFHIRMGSLRLFAHDYLDPKSRAFIEALYRESFRNGTVEGRILVQHHLSMYGYRPSAEFAPTAMLIGHIHNHRVVDRWPYPILMGAAAHKYARGAVLRLARRDGRWTTDAGESWMASALSLVGDYGAPKVAAAYNEPNDGRSNTNAVTLTNALTQRFDDGRVRLVLREGRYSVRGGDVLSRYPIGGGKTAVLVRVDIPRDGTTRLEAVPHTSSTFVMGDGVQAPTTDGGAVPLDETGAPLLEPPPADLTNPAPAPDDPGATVDPPEATDTQPHRVALPLLH